MVRPPSMWEMLRNQGSLELLIPPQAAQVLALLRLVPMGMGLGDMAALITAISHSRRLLESNTNIYTEKPLRVNLQTMHSISRIPQTGSAIGNFSIASYVITLILSIL